MLKKRLEQSFVFVNAREAITKSGLHDLMHRPRFKKEMDRSNVRKLFATIVEFVL